MHSVACSKPRRGHMAYRIYSTILMVLIVLYLIKSSAYSCLEVPIWESQKYLCRCYMHLCIQYAAYQVTLSTLVVLIHAYQPSSTLTPHSPVPSLPCVRSALQSASVLFSPFALKQGKPPSFLHLMVLPLCPEQSIFPSSLYSWDWQVV